MNTHPFRWLIGLALYLAAGALLLGLAPATRFRITVTTTTDEFGSGADCSLREAIRAANAGADFDGCTRVFSSIGSDPTRSCCRQAPTP